MAGASRNLSDVLEDLKARSGLRYESIGRKVHASKSTVHRYCTGLSLPPEFGVVERIGLACGATRTEMLLLHSLWVRATTPDNVELPVAAVARPDTPAPRPTRWRRPVSLAALCLIVALTSAGTPPVPSTTPLSAQWVSGPAWTLPAAQVPSTMFGVTINSATGAMPGFRVGAVRLWDGGTRWSEIQAQRDEFDWSVLDRLVGGAEHAGLPVLFVFGGTPRWAAPTGAAGPYPDGSSSAPPDSLADWDAYVEAVVQRYRGRISSYELWVLANDKRFYSGSVETLMDMTLYRSISRRAWSGRQDKGVEIMVR